MGLISKVPTKFSTQPEGACALTKATRVMRATVKIMVLRIIQIKKTTKTIVNGDEATRSMEWREKEYAMHGHHSF